MSAMKWMRGTGFAMALGLLLAAISAPAATWTLVSGTGYWTNSANWLPVAVPGPADDVVISNGSATIMIGGDVAINSLSITNTFTGKLTFSNLVAAGLSMAGDLYLKTNATIECTASSTGGNGTGRVISVGGNALINGTVTGDSLGFADGAGPSPGGNNVGGASHGGIGSRGQAIYGSLTQPTSLGSGGSGSVGGGAVKIAAGNTLTVNGSIVARALAGHDGGAGGSIWLACSNLAGSGRIDASGANGTAATGSGAGGRIALSFTNSTFSGVVSAAGGYNTGYPNDATYIRLSQPGTLWAPGFLPSTGNLVITAGGYQYWYPAGSTQNLDTVTIANLDQSGMFFLHYGTLTIRDLVVSNALLRFDVNDSGTVIGSGMALDALSITGSISVASAGANLIDQGWLYLPSMGTYALAGDLRCATNAVIYPLGSTTNVNAASGGTVGTPHGAGLTLTCANATIGGTINGDSLGFADNSGPAAGNNNSGGASYGGRGSRNLAPYGSLTQPTALGSGGWSSPGGGAIKITATSVLTVNGSITARALLGHDGGAGGSIWLVCSNFTGSGNLYATGGNNNGTGSGSGGRIALNFTNCTFSGIVDAAGGLKTDGTGSQPGTLWAPGFLPSTGDLTIAAGGYQYWFPVGSTQNWGAVTIANLDQSGMFFLHNGTYTIRDLLVSNALLRFDIDTNGNPVGAADVDAVSMTGSITVASASAGAIDGGYLYLPQKGVYTLAGSLTCRSNTVIYPLGNTVVTNTDSGGTGASPHGAGLALQAANAYIDGTINGDGLGFPTTSGPGGSIVGGGWGSGGSYGGRGGASNAKAPYGSLSRPTALGSGGSNLGGGGAVKLTTANAIVLNGSITTRGLASAGGPSGGSIWLKTPSLSGGGSLLATGGTGGSGAWSDGGGGRIAVETASNTFSGALSAAGGTYGSSSTTPATGTWFNCQLPTNDLGVSIRSDYGVNANSNGVKVTRTIGTWSSASVQWTDTPTEWVTGNPLSNTVTYTIGVLPGNTNMIVYTNSTLMATQTTTAAGSLTIGPLPLTAPLTVRVDLPAITPPTATVSGSTAIAPGGSATIQAALTGIAPWALVWSDGFVQNTVTSSPVTRAVSPVTTMVYTVTAVSIGPVFGTSSGSATVTVLSVTASSDASQIVIGDTLHLSASTVPGALAYNWTRSGGGFSTNGQYVTDMPSPGSYTYTVTVPTTNGTCVGSTPTVVVLAGIAPGIRNAAATGVATNAATLNGVLTNIGTAANAVGVYWGTDTNAWANTNWFNGGAVNPACTNNTPFSTNIASGISASKTYYYTYTASNNWGTAVASPPASFISGVLTVWASDPTGRTAVADTAAFTVTRPITCTNEAVVVNYTLGGTAAYPADYAILPVSGAVIIAQGQTTGTVTVTPVYKMDVEKTVVLTLAPGLYAIGASNSATCILAAPSGKTTVWTLGSGTDYWTNAANWSAGVPAPVDNAVISNGSATIIIGGDVTINSLNVTGSYTGKLTFSNLVAAGLNVFNDLYLKTNASIECTASSTNGNGTGRVITVGGNALINGTVNADSLGFADASGPAGTTFNVGGASHGGRGNANLAPYGSLPQPTSLGSGGAQSAGGGAVKIAAANTLTVNGTITARALAGHDGGAGGSIWLVCSNLAGNGRVDVRGGDGTASTGSGGGGRIALAFTNSTFSGIVSAAGGYNTAFPNDATNIKLSQPGTLWAPGFLPSTGDLAITTGGYQYWYPAGSTQNYGTVTIANLEESGMLFLHYGSLIIRDLVVSNALVRFDINDSGAVMGNAMALDALSITGSITVASASATVIDQGVLYLPSAGAYSLAGDLRCATNAVIYPLANLTNVNAASGGTTGTPHGAGLTLTCANATIAGTINGDSLGFADATGPAAGDNNAGGASYGGRGTRNLALYGLLTQPTALGSGGAGSAGGGAVKIAAANALTVNGSITARALVGHDGGAGGSIWLVCGTLAGTGRIDASGGNGSSTGAGGGGRIALAFTNTTFSGVVSAAGGIRTTDGALASQPGTLWAPGYLPSSGDLTVTTGGYQYWYPAGSTQNFGTVTVANLDQSGMFFLHNGTYTIRDLLVSNALLRFDIDTNGNPVGAADVDAVSMTGSITVAAASAGAIDGGFLYLPQKGVYALAGDLTCRSNTVIYPLGNTAITNQDSGGTSGTNHGAGVSVSAANAYIDGTINGDGLGFPMASGPGGSIVGGGAGSGASYGGRGGAANAKAPYGSLSRPTALGSGGEANSGGGAVKLTTANAIVLNGSITTRGLGSGGGPGSIWLKTPSLSGGGSLLATAPSGGSGAHSDGGGGRIAVETASNTFSGVLSAAGGAYGNSSTLPATGTWFNCQLPLNDLGMSIQSDYGVNANSNGAKVTRAIVTWTLGTLSWTDTSTEWATGNSLSNSVTYTLTGLPSSQRLAVLTNAVMMAKMSSTAAGSLTIGPLPLTAPLTVKVEIAPRGTVFTFR